MSYNIIAYLIYGTVISTIIIRVGKLCYTHGNVFISNFIPDQIPLSRQVNKTLLVGYYLVNIGYGVYVISSWKPIINWTDLISQTAFHVGQITLILCMLHYLNIAGIHFIFNKQKQF